MIILRQKYIFREDIKKNPHVLYIFGDNLKREGFGGQAKEMRGEPNSFGIATKRAPTYNPEDFFYDTDLDIQEIVYDEFQRLHSYIALKEPIAIVIPADGIGTGIAKLKENAPNLLHYINAMLEELERKYNG